MGKQEGMKSFYFLLLRGMLRGARESVSLSNNRATSFPTRRILPESHRHLESQLGSVSEIHTSTGRIMLVATSLSLSASPEEADLMHLEAYDKHRFDTEHSLNHSAVL